MIYENNHSTCPLCKSNNVAVNESIDEEVDDTLYCHFWCEDCDRGYQAIYSFSYAEGEYAEGDKGDVSR